MLNRALPITLLCAGMTLPVGGFCSSRIVCADFCQGTPLVHEDGKKMRNMYLNTCEPTDSFALECDRGPTISCACRQDYDGNYVFTRGEDRGPPDCESLCSALNYRKKHWWCPFSWCP
jgi:hypothetical protein